MHCSAPKLPSLAASLLALGLFATPSAHALDVPRLQGPVNDYANMLSAPEREALANRLNGYRDQTGYQFALLTVPTLDGQPIEDFGIKVAEQWKLGSEKGDEGLILIIALNDKRMRVEVGYGLEGTVTDAVAARVLREVLGPALGAGAYSQGINAAFDTLTRAASGDVAQAQPKQKKRRETAGKLSPLILPIILFIIISFLGGGRGRRRRGIWGGPFIGLGGGGFGGGGFGGGGGGYSGGGGGFGGGGASGSW